MRAFDDLKGVHKIEAVIHGILVGVFFLVSEADSIGLDGVGDPFIREGRVVIFPRKNGYPSAIHKLTGVQIFEFRMLPFRL